MREPRERMVARVALSLDATVQVGPGHLPLPPTPPGLTPAERRAHLALRIALARLVPPQPAPAPVTEPAPDAVAMPARPDPAALPGPAPDPQPLPEPEHEPAPAPSPARPRKPARVSMSTVRLEDAALLLGAAFASDDDDDRPAAPDPAAPQTAEAATDQTG